VINKEIFIFLAVISLITLLLFDATLQFIILFYISAIFLYLALNRKNRFIGLPSMVATFTVLLFLYIFGLIGKCHLCTTEKDGVIFYCNRLINLAPLDYENQIGDKECKKELIWRWPPS
tara:strand:+ start:2792 stop:3148 length:357 start_codon:yes stop_codon:yes gene_type:complete